MISVGIDVAKGKSTVCILKPYGEIVSKPFDIAHNEKDLSELASMLLRFNEEVKVVMEATGIYHLPVLTYLQEKGLFVSVINPYLMKVYRSGDLRKAKTDKIDSRIIANYGIDHWFTMPEFQASYLRAYPGVERGSEEWEETYKIRGNVEKFINHFKDSFCVADRKTRNKKTLHADLLLAGIAQHVTVIVADKIHQHQYNQSLKPLIA